jgi:DNA (cytosine-5)-methyltransferase 1
MKCVWQVEIDDYATRVLEKHWPDVRRWRDVRTFPPEPAEEWRCDLIAGGFPCQGISLAGKGDGIRAKRSGLWNEFVRVVRVLRPRYWLVENVAAILARGMGTVLGDISESGYDAEWAVLSAASVGAPHIRERVFILGHLPDTGSGRGPRDELCTGGNISGLCGEILADAASIRRNRDRTKPRIIGTRKAKGRLSQFARSNGRSQWSTEPDVGRVADGIPHRVDRLRCLGNAVVPQVAEWIGRRIVEAESR